MSPTRIFRRTIGVWAAIVMMSEGLRIWVVLHGPPDPDLYANSLSFQLVGSLWLIIGMWLPTLIGVVVVEWGALALVDRVRVARSRKIRWQP